MTVAILKSGGTRPEPSEMLMMLVGGEHQGFRTVILWEWDQGRVIWRHFYIYFFFRIFETNCSVSAVNVCSNIPE